MLIVASACLGVALLGGSYFKLSLGGVGVFELYVFLTGVYYIVSAVSWKRRSLRVSRSMKCLAVFVTYGFVVVVLSYLGIYDVFATSNLLVDHDFIPRQAFCLFFLPLAIVAPINWRKRERHFRIEEHLALIYFSFYFACIVISGQWAISLPMSLIMGFLLVCEKRRTISSYLMLLAIVFIPIGVGGELTQAIVRSIAVFLFLFKRGVGLLDHALLLCALTVIAVTLGAGLALNAMPIQLETNSLWRLNYWADEMNSLFDSFGLGVGYGTSYASVGFLDDALSSSPSGPFAASAGYTTLDRAFITGSHNSFASIAFRLGIFGFLLFCAYVWSVHEEMREGSGKGSTATFVFYASVFLIAFNVGLESTLYLFFFIFGFAYCEIALGMPQNATSLSSKGEMPDEHGSHRTLRS